MDLLRALMAGGGLVIYTTWNPADKAPEVDLSNGDLTVTKDSGGGADSVRSVDGKSSGKWYIELTNSAQPITGPQGQFGIMNASGSLTSEVGATGSNGYGDVSESANTEFNNSNTAYGAAWDTSGDVVQMAFDMDNGKIWWGVNGTFDGDPAAGTGEAYSGIAAGTWFAAVSLQTTTVVATANFGATPFAHSIPSGFVGWREN